MSVLVTEQNMLQTGTSQMKRNTKSYHQKMIFSRSLSEEVTIGYKAEAHE